MIGNPLAPCPVKDQDSLPQLENGQKASDRANSHGVVVDVVCSVPTKLLNPTGTIGTL